MLPPHGPYSSPQSIVGTAKTIPFKGQKTVYRNPLYLRTDVGDILVLIFSMPTAAHKGCEYKTLSNALPSSPYN